MQRLEMREEPKRTQPKEERERERLGRGKEKRTGKQGAGNRGTGNCSSCFSHKVTDREKESGRQKRKIIRVKKWAKQRHR